MPVSTIPVQAVPPAIDGLPGITLRCPLCGCRRVVSASQGRGAGPIERSWRCENCRGTWVISRVPTRATCVECGDGFWQRRTDQTYCGEGCRHRRGGRAHAKRKREAKTAKKGAAA